MDANGTPKRVCAFAPGVRVSEDLVRRILALLENIRFGVSMFLGAYDFAFDGGNPLHSSEKANYVGGEMTRFSPLCTHFTWIWRNGHFWH